MSEEVTHTSGSYRIELLKGNNWLPWKRRMLAVLRDQGLETYVEKSSVAPAPKDPQRPTKEEADDLKKWTAGDAKTRTRIELAIGDSEMVHIIGAKTAHEMWSQLTIVKESRGKLGILATRRALYRSIAEEGFDLIEHISKLRKLQEELHLMGSLVSDEDFAMILVSSLPESWDLYTSAYLGSKTDGTSLTSYELIAILLEEERRRKERSGDPRDVAMHGKFANKSDRSKKFGNDPEKECYNCHKKGHMAKECWSKGGGKEGQGPKARQKGRSTGGNNNRTHQAADKVNNTLMDVAYMAGLKPATKDEWILDSATSSHISNNRMAFVDYFPLKDSTVKGIGKEPATAAGIGTILLDFNVDNKTIGHQIKNVLHVPEAPNSLLSVSRFDEAGGTIDFKDGKCFLRNKGGQLVGTGVKQDRLYLLGAKTRVVAESAHAASTSKSWNEWHKLYGHLGMKSLEILKQKKLVDGINIDTSTAPSSCDACIQAKQTVLPFPQESENRSKIPGERTYSDVWGPARTQSIGGSRYYISFIDDATRTVTVFFMKTKDEATNYVKQYLTEIEKKFDRKPKYIRFDNGKELVNKEMIRWAAEKGIVIETTAPYSPSQHGTAERMNRTLLELARAMLIEMGLRPSLWPEAVAHATYIRNRSPTRALENKTPYEAWHGKRPNVRHFKEFGSDVWILEQQKKPSKLAPKSYKMKFVGFLDSQKSVRYFDAAKGTIRVSRNFRFSDRPMIEEETTEIPEIPSLQFEGEQEPDGESQTPEPSETAPEPIRETLRQQDAPSRRSGRATDHDYRRLNNPAARPTTRQVKPHKDNNAEAHIAYAFISAIKEENGLTESNPMTLKEALEAHDAEDWKNAIQVELDQHVLEMKTWELVDLPEGRQPIGNKWVFVRKRDEAGNVIKHKARLVAQGFSQKPGIDYSETGTFAPVMRFDTLRTLLAIAAIEDWDIQQVDIKGAYLNGQLKEEIYMKQPTGYEDGTKRVCILFRLIYGLKQAGNVWNEEFDQTMKNMGYTRLRTDYCAYVLRTSDDMSILIVWVDDINMFAKKRSTNEELIKRLKEKYEITVLGEPTLLLGIHIQRDRKNRSITLSQAQYVRKILEKARMSESKPVSTPMDPNITLHETDDQNDTETNSRTSNEYATRVGELMYAAHATRPDILYATVTLAQFTKNPSPTHWTALKRVFRYLIGTTNHTLTYDGRRSSTIEPERFVDADWASNPHRKSISGYVFTIAGGAVAWSSKKQSRIALSTAEAEYVAAVHAVKQVLWFRNFYQELDLPVETPSIVQSDNQAAISISHNPEFHARTKHIDIDMHFLRDHVQQGNIKLEYVPSESNLADVFTKALNKPSHSRIVSSFGVLPGPGGVLG